MTLKVTRTFALIWSTCIIIGTILRGSQVGQHLHTAGYAHMLAHAVVFSVLGGLLWASFRRQVWQVLAILFGLALATGSEVYEHLMFGSPLERRDIAVNILSLVITALLLWGVSGRRIGNMSAMKLVASAAKYTSAS